MRYSDILELGEQTVPEQHPAAARMLINDLSHAVAMRNTSQACSAVPCD
jgi:hypothetical protein